MLQHIEALTVVKMFVVQVEAHAAITKQTGRSFVTEEPQIFCQHKHPPTQLLFPIPLLLTSQSVSLNKNQWRLYMGWRGTFSASVPA